MKTFDTFISIFALMIAGIFREFSANYLAQKLSVSDSFIFILFIVFLSILIIWFLHFRKKLAVDINVDVLKEDYQKKENAHRGLVLILSPFTPYGKLAQFKQNNPEEYNKAMEDLDIDSLNLDDTSQSNFGHAVVALKAHKEKLEHVWLICSSSSSGKTSQSIDYAPLLERYIQKKINNKVKVHYGNSYTVLLDEDSSVCRQSFKIIKKIYKEAKKFGLKTKDMITDVTGGVKSINIGAILACLNRDEDIQIIGTTYDEDGKIKGESFPMIIEYKPSLLETD